MASFFSRNTASRSRMVSRMPPASPAATMFTNRSENALGCLRSASARVWPLSTSYTTWRVTSAKTLFSVCSARMVSACTRGNPALIMVANWRVMMTTSSRDGRSTSPCCRSPFKVRAVYWKTGMAHSRRRLAARGNFGLTGLRPAGLRQCFPLVQRLLADHPQELVRIGGDPQTLLLRHFTVHVELVERIGERLHPILLPGLHRRLDLVDLVVADQRPDGGRAHHDLRRHDPAPPLELLKQRLGDHPLQHEGELRPDLRLLVRGEDVDDAVDGLRRRVGV